MTLLRAIEIYSIQTGISSSRLGREALGDPGLVRALRRGRQLRPETRKRLLAYLSRGGVTA